MGRSIALVLVLLGALLLLLALTFIPWLRPQQAEIRAEAAFLAVWDGVIDGCGFNCEGCGARTSVRRFGGYAVELEYACGMLPADLPEYHERAIVFVSDFGTVHGLSRP